MNKIKISADFALLLARIIIGGIFIYAGYLKVADMQMTVTMFDTMGLGSFWAYLVSYGEIVAGVMLILGFWTLIASVFLSIVMFAALWLSRSMGIQMLMTPMAVLAALLAIWGSGSGKFALSRKS